MVVMSQQASKRGRLIFAFWLFAALPSFGQAPGASAQGQTTPQKQWERLNQTRVLNMHEILKQKNLWVQGHIRTPYAFPLEHLKAFPSTSPAVCALKFTSQKQDTYVLKTFQSAAAALKAGYSVTHTGSCGACSGLKDLYIYLTQPNLTTPVRSCASQWFSTASSLKKCLVEKVGFTSWCADVWRYNVQNSREKCFDICVKEYAWWNLL